MVTFIDVKKEAVQPLLLQAGLALWELKTPWELLRMKGPVTAVLFKSGKLLLQGRPDALEKYHKLLLAHGFREEKKPSFVRESGIIIGSDETLKGDTFGGLVVAAVMADDKVREELLLLGVQDSKKINDRDIPDLAREIEKRTDHVVKSIYPEEYNRHSQTELLNTLHRQCAEQLTQKATHVVDKYPGCTVGDIRTTHAEDKYLEVAAASILARHAGLQQLQVLSAQLGYPVPKGSTHVKDALLFVKTSGKDPLQFVKLHFRNVKEILG
ncbi:ribonuclease HIII [Candidatus Woesearchaeota archaeon]|nr:ribonuclease HIII [Candidatus Woesearchaeota archaeon]